MLYRAKYFGVEGTFYQRNGSSPPAIYNTLHTVCTNDSICYHHPDGLWWKLFTYTQIQTLAYTTLPTSAVPPVYPNRVISTLQSCCCWAFSGGTVISLPLCLGVRKSRYGRAPYIRPRDCYTGNHPLRGRIGRCSIRCMYSVHTNRWFCRIRPLSLRIAK